MYENDKSFYPSNMFEIIHHPEYGCCDLKGLRNFFNISFNIENLKKSLKINPHGAHLLQNK
jgi:hypothetical protein